MAYPEPTAVGKQKALFDQGKNGPTHVIDYSKKWALPDQQHGGNIIRPLQEDHVLKSGKHPQNRDPVPFQVANIITAFENNKFANNNIGTSFLSTSLKKSTLPSGTAKESTKYLPTLPQFSTPPTRERGPTRGT